MEFAMNKTCDEDDLVRAVTERGGSHRVVSSREIKDWMEQHSITWDRPGRSGGHLEQADHAAVKQGRLLRWERCVRRRIIGFTLPNNVIKDQDWEPSKG